MNEMLVSNTDWHFLCIFTFLKLCGNIGVLCSDAHYDAGRLFFRRVAAQHRILSL